MGLLDRIKHAVRGRDGRTPAERPGRNDPCWCGSGKKYKKCHLPEDDRNASAGACTLNCGPS
jgi:hypothetical protein